MARTTIKELWEIIEFLNCKLEEAASGRRIAKTLDNELVELLRGGKFISAIKLYRDRTKSCLLDSKRHVERLRTEMFLGKYGDFNEDNYRYYLDNKAYMDLIRKSA